MFSPRQLYRYLLTLIHDWAEPDPPARVQERVCSLTLYSTAEREVKATPRKPPVDDLVEVCLGLTSPPWTLEEEDEWKAREAKG